MKFLKNPVILLALCFSFFTCKEANEPSDLRRLEQNEIDFLISQGLHPCPDALVDQDILLEGDIILPINTLHQWMEEDASSENIAGGAEDRQYVITSSNVVSIGNTVNIDYFIGSSVTSAWATAITAATADWTNISRCRVSFNRVYSHGAADISFFNKGDAELPNPSGFNSLTAPAAACYPTNGNPGRFCAINNSEYWNNQINGTADPALFRRNIIRHEIGHTLGIMHTDAPLHNESANFIDDCNNSQTGLVHLHTTSTSDPNSVFDKDTYPLLMSDFSGDDIRTAVTLYPDDCCAPVINWALVEPSGLGGLKTITINFTLPKPEYILEFQLLSGGLVVESAQKQGAREGTYTYYHLTNKRGVYQLRMRGKNYKLDFSGPFSNQKTISL